MKTLSPRVLLLACTGCFHLHRKPVVASAEVAAKVQFPEWSQEATTTLTGPQLKALQVALDDFRPLSSGLFKHGDTYTQCLQKIETYDAWVRRGEEMTFIHFTPKEDKWCGLQPTLMDAEANYAISDDGVSLKRE